MEYEYYETQIFDDGSWMHDLEVLAVRQDIAARNALVDAIENDNTMANSQWQVRSRLTTDRGYVGKWHTYKLTGRLTVRIDEG